MDRRSMLVGTAIALATPLAGCLSEDDAGESAPDDGAEDGDPPETADDTLEYDVHQVGFFRATYDPLEDDAVGSLEVFESAADAHDRAPLEEIDATDPSATEEFVTETDFERDLLCSVVTTWPNTSDAAVEVETLERRDDRLVATARATGKQAGDDAPSFPVALVRVTVEDDPPVELEMTVVDGRENEETLRADVS
ncbi:hypothetical protein [Natronorubrum texcoconense]|uniref:Uncharacterized protein n=1 Tax=Natronorubrum texcoconense TaxID=1095776 RepID=A0A1G9E9T7_9EURY|nr:hypothetical protein [Natronorubrum texcoconense]SDK72919.1 hypothetical protein SAMN04515672_3821 [Natronorubrum texcoconense]